MKDNDLVRALFDLEQWRNNPQADWFTIYLYQTINKADQENRTKLEKVFPVQVIAYKLWQVADSEEEFFKEVRALVDKLEFSESS